MSNTRYIVTMKLRPGVATIDPTANIRNAISSSKIQLGCNLFNCTVRLVDHNNHLVKTYNYYNNLPDLQKRFSMKLPKADAFAEGCYVLQLDYWGVSHVEVTANSEAQEKCVMYHTVRAPTLRQGFWINNAFAHSKIGYSKPLELECTVPITPVGSELDEWMHRPSFLPYIHDNHYLFCHEHQAVVLNLPSAKIGDNNKALARQIDQSYRDNISRIKHARERSNKEIFDYTLRFRGDFVYQFRLLSPERSLEVVEGLISNPQVLFDYHLDADGVWESYLKPRLSPEVWARYEAAILAHRQKLDRELFGDSGPSGASITPQESAVRTLMTSKNTIRYKPY